MSSQLNILTFVCAFCVCLIRTESNWTTLKDRRLDLFSLVFSLLLVHASVFTLRVFPSILEQNVPVAVCAACISSMAYVFKELFSVIWFPLVWLTRVCPFIQPLGKHGNQSRVSPVFQQIVDTLPVTLVSPAGSGCRKQHILVVAIHKGSAG